MAQARRRTSDPYHTEPPVRRTEAPQPSAPRPVATIIVPSGTETDVWREARRMRDEWRRNRYARLKPV